MNDFGTGGVQRLVINTATEMINRGIDVHILTLKGEKKDTLIRENPVKPRNFKYIEFGSLLNIISWLRVWYYIFKLKPDTVMTQMWMANTVGRVSSYLAGVKKIIIFEQNVYDTVKSKKLYFLDSIMQYLGNPIVASSPAVVDSLIRHGIKKEKIRLIYNGVAIPKELKDKDLEFKKILGINQDTFVYINVARYVEQKAIDIILKAFAKTDTDSILLLVGWGPEEAKLKKQAEQLKITDRVKFLTGRSDVQALFNISDVFLLPSRYEGFSIALLEAMANRKPIIISDFEAGKQVIQNETSGLVVKIEDIDGLTTALNRMHFDQELREKLASNAKIKVEDYGIVKYVDKLLAL